MIIASLLKNYTTALAQRRLIDFLINASHEITKVSSAVVNKNAEKQKARTELFWIQIDVGIFGVKLQQFRVHIINTYLAQLNVSWSC